MRAGDLRSRASGRESEMAAAADPVLGQGRGIPGAANQGRRVTARRYSAYVGGRFEGAALDAQHFKKTGQRRRSDDGNGRDGRERGAAQI